MNTHTYRVVDVTVDGGLLRVGIWDPSEADTQVDRKTDSAEVPTVLAVHGITATHRAWDLLPPALPGVRIVAPDLRGRGRSNDLPGPYGLAQHAEDLAAALTALNVTGVVVLGHSMGAFVAVLLARSCRDLVQEAVLVDGGLPLEIPKGVDPDDLAQAALGPALQRLAMTFPDVTAYREFWSAHPAFGPGQVAELTGYFDYDLDRDSYGWLPSSRIEAVKTDQRELVTGEAVAKALTELVDLQVPLTFIHAPRGLLDDAPLYRPDYARGWARRLPSLRMVWARDVNHYTVVMSSPGAQFVAGQLAPAPEGVQ